MWRTFAVVALCALVAMAQEEKPCAVPCTFPPHWWAAHKTHAAWQALAGTEMCNSTAQDALTGSGAAHMDDAGHEAAAQVITAQLNVAGCPLAAPSSLATVATSLQHGCVGAKLDEKALGELTDWNAGREEGGPCHCTDLECARYVNPQAVIDEEMVAIEKLSSAEIGFLVWAIVATVIMVILAVVVVVLLARMDWQSWTWWHEWTSSSAPANVEEDGGKAALLAQTPASTSAGISL